MAWPVKGGLRRPGALVRHLLLAMPEQLTTPCWHQRRAARPHRAQALRQMSAGLDGPPPALDLPRRGRAVQRKLIDVSEPCLPCAHKVGVAMRRVVVAVCGSPMSGKMTLLRSIALLTGSDQLELWRKPWQSRARLVVDLPGMKVGFVTVTGLFFPERTDIVDEIVQYADVVMYLSSTMPAKESEFVYFARFRDSAKRFGKMWDEIPWLFVLNVFEGRSESVLPQMIPQDYQGDILVCNAAMPTDIQQVWEVLLRQPPLVAGEG